MEEAFILKQLHRNAGLYRACLIVFRVIMGCIALGGILNAFGILTIRLAIHEALIFLSVILQYKSFTRLKEATETAIIEMEKAQKTPGFRIPEDYSPQTQYAISQTAKDTKSVLVQAIGFGILGITLASLGILLLFLGHDVFFLAFSALLIAGSLPLFAYMALYIADLQAVKEIERKKKESNPD